MSGAIPAGATILKTAPRLPSQNDIDAQARLTAQKAAVKAARDTAKAQANAREWEAMWRRVGGPAPPVVALGAPVAGGPFPAPAPPPPPPPIMPPTGPPVRRPPAAPPPPPPPPRVGPVTPSRAEISANALAAALTRLNKTQPPATAPAARVGPDPSSLAAQAVKLALKFGKQKDLAAKIDTQREARLAAQQEAASQQRVLERELAVAVAARAAKAGTSSSAAGPSSSAAGASTSASIGTDTGPEDPLADKVVLKSDGSLFKSYKWNSKALNKAMSEGVVRMGVDGRLYRRSLEDINAEREALAAATAASLPKVGPSTVLSEAETTVPVLPTPASPPRLTDAEVDAILTGEGRGKHSEIQAVGFPQDSWTPAQARKWLRDHGAVPIKGMRREGSWLRWRITPPERYGRYTTKTLRSNGRAVHLVMGWR